MTSTLLNHLEIKLNDSTVIKKWLLLSLNPNSEPEEILHFSNDFEFLIADDSAWQALFEGKPKFVFYDKFNSKLDPEIASLASYTRELKSPTTVFVSIGTDKIYVFTNTDKLQDFSLWGKLLFRLGQLGSKLQTAYLEFA